MGLLALASCGGDNPPAATITPPQAPPPEVEPTVPVVTAAPDLGLIPLQSVQQVREAAPAGHPDPSQPLPGLPGDGTAPGADGATDPSARLTIGGEEVPLSTDGTFRIQVPFRDGEQVYAIEATAADGEQKRNITLNFERQTPEDNSNPASEARAEWF